MECWDFSWSLLCYTQVLALVLGIGIARGQYYWVLDIGCLSWYRSNPSQYCRILIVYFVQQRLDPCVSLLILYIIITRRCAQPAARNGWPLASQWLAFFLPPAAPVAAFHQFALRANIPAALHDRCQIIGPVYMSQILLHFNFDSLVLPLSIIKIHPTPIYIHREKQYVSQNVLAHFRFLSHVSVTVRDGYAHCTKSTFTVSAAIYVCY